MGALTERQERLLDALKSRRRVVTTGRVHDINRQLGAPKRSTARPVIAAQHQALDEARNLNHRLTTARDFADSDAAGYIDRTGLENA